MCDNRKIKITYVAVAWWDSMSIALATFELERLQRTTCIMITGAMRTTPTKVLEMFLDLPILGTTMESAELMAAYHLTRPELRNLLTGHNWICAKVNKVNSKFSMIKDRVTPKRIFNKNQTVILTRKNGRKTGPIS